MVFENRDVAYLHSPRLAQHDMCHSAMSQYVRLSLPLSHGLLLLCKFVELYTGQNITIYLFCVNVMPAQAGMAILLLQ